jgi:hypothetical protein
MITRWWKGRGKKLGWTEMDLLEKVRREPLQSIENLQHHLRENGLLQHFWRTTKQQNHDSTVKKQWQQKPNYSMHNHKLYKIPI